MTIIAAPQTVTALVEGLDHPECVCLGSDGLLQRPAGGVGAPASARSGAGPESAC